MTLEYYLVLSVLLFAIGLFGAFSRKNAIMILMCIEIMLNAVNIALVAFTKFHLFDMISGQVFTIMSIVVAAAEVTIGLAIVIAIFRNFKEIDTDNINLLKW